LCAEYLPSIIGSAGVNTYGLKDTYANDDSCDATLYNVFATAAFRFGHSMVPDSLYINGQAYSSIDLFNRPSFVLHHLDSLIEGLVNNASEKVDRWYSLGEENIYKSTGGIL
jgi:peroxidase